MPEEEMQMPGTGALQSPADYRYVNVEHLAGAALSVIPASYHIDFSAVPDLYQRKIGACTNHAAAELRMRRELRLTGQVKHYSPRFSYTLCKIEDGTAADEQGTFPVMPLKMGVKYGFATENTIVNDTTLAFDDYIYHRTLANIPAAAFDEAAQNKIPGYAQVGKFNNITMADLAHGLINSVDGVKVCMPIGAEWYTAPSGRTSWASADVLPIRKVVTPISGHDITVTGYDVEASTGRYKIYFRNHWSTAWADKDYGWFYFDDHQLSEAWMISEIPDALVAILKSLPKQSDFSYNWTRDLAPGDSGPDVQAMQIALKIVGVFPFLQPVTPYFGTISAQAVRDFQEEYHIASAAEIAASAGKLGPKTRAAINKMFNRN